MDHKQMVDSGMHECASDCRTHGAAMRSWVLMLRSSTDSQIVRIWAHDEDGMRRIVADLHPGYTIQTMRAEVSTILPFCVHPEVARDD